MSNTPVTNAVFATPLYRVLTGATEINEAVKSFLLDKETEDFRNPNSPQATHKNLFESKFDLFHWADPEIENLKAALYENLMRYIIEINGISPKDAELLTFKHESWFHISRKGAYFQPHTHPLASVSMVYCVDPGDQSIDDIESGALVFTDPRHNASMFLDPTNRNMNRQFSFSQARIKLKKDELVIFPSYLQHHVEPYAGETPRITVAANFSFKFK